MRATQRSFSLLPSLFVFALTPLAMPLSAEDWPEWRGAGRLGVWHEDGVLEMFPEDGLEVAWRVPVHSGFAGPAVADGRIFVLDWRRNEEGVHRLDGLERVLCLDEATGEVLWSHEWPADYAVLMASYAIGPRATPTVDGDRVYVVGAVGDLVGLKVETGEALWQVDYVEDFDASIATWGVSSAPLIDGDLLITVAGGEPDGKVMAFDKRNGEEVWRALSSDWEMGYGQPVIFEMGGARQLIVWQPQAVSSLDPRTGEVYWEIPWDVAYGMTVSTPVIHDQRLLVSQFYRGSLMLELSTERPMATTVWKGKSDSEMPDKTDGLHSLITTPIFEDGHIYGVGSYGELRGLNAASGERLWASDRMTRQGRWSAAFMVKSGDRYFVNNDQGDLIIARFTPKGYEEIDRTHLIEPTSHSGFTRGGRFDALVNWSHPAYANLHIVARNDQEVLRASLAGE